MPAFLISIFFNNSFPCHPFHHLISFFVFLYYLLLYILFVLQQKLLYYYKLQAAPKQVIFSCSACKIRTQSALFSTFCIHLYNPIAASSMCPIPIFLYFYIYLFTHDASWLDVRRITNCKNHIFKEKTTLYCMLLTPPPNAHNPQTKSQFSLNCQKNKISKFRHFWRIRLSKNSPKMTKIRV